ncbi:4-hydroxybenzoate polyprenyltransferase [Saonia flava]|uniref:4-hydroxybenzoate polyprenyltransferase n=1 Tax=Saonia flava TaxID=523696 RepID=A0A846QVY1_9FLAO|nr:UbiA-like protein EboC [Saonia flava]NJB70443.1 4-hydroxybenzoate polyprenyltransferase [Saonia flava]
MNATLKGYLQLTRPANLPTSAADVMAGMVIAGIFGAIGSPYFWGEGNLMPSIFLMSSSVFLYAGGVVLNDVFDFPLDMIERPERPIPSGVVSLKSAYLFGGALLLLGVAFAFYVNIFSGSIAFVLALAILLYDIVAKKYSFFGPLNMGVCRGLNLLLGMSVFGTLLHWEYCLVPIVYIAAITLISRGEVHGNNKNHLILTGILYAFVIGAVLGLHYLNGNNTLQVIPFILLFGILIYRPLVKAYMDNTPVNIKKAVIGGVLSIIVLDAIFAVGFSNWRVGIGMLLLLPLSIFLSKLFAVT